MPSRPRTEFYDQALIGVGTREVECLRSYVQRLALAHHMSPRVLMAMMTGKKYSDTRLREGIVHSTGANGKRLVESIERATGVTLSGSTMARFSHLLPTQHLVRGNREERRYCPICVLEPHDLSLRHGRLLWELSAVDACPTHGVVLERAFECCAPIEEHLRIDSRPSLPAVCSTCGSIGFGCHTQSEPARESSTWASAEIGDLLAMDDRTVASLDAEQLRDGLADVVRIAFGGQPVRASREANLARGSVLTWLQGKSRPALGCLVQFAFAARASLTRMFFGHYEESRRPITCSENVETRRREYRRVDWAEVQQELEKALRDPGDPVSLNAFARRANVDRSLLRRHFPAEYLSLRSRCKTFDAEEKRKIELSARAAYASAATALCNEGKTITKNKLQRITGLWLYSGAEGSPRGVAMQEVLQAYRPRGTQDPPG